MLVFFIKLWRFGNLLLQMPRASVCIIIVNSPSPDLMQPISHKQVIDLIVNSIASFLEDKPLFDVGYTVIRIFKNPYLPVVARGSDVSCNFHGTSFHGRRKQIQWWGEAVYD